MTSLLRATWLRASLLRPTLLVLAALVAIAIPRPAQAELGSHVVMVRPFNGAKKQQIRNRVVATLEDKGVALVPQAKASRLNTPEDYALASAELGVTAFIEGNTTMAKSGWTLKLTIRSGSDGAVVEDVSLKAGWLPGLLKEIDKSLIAKVEPALDKTLEGMVQNTEESEEVVVEEQEPPATVEDSGAHEEDDHGAGPAGIPFEVSAGLGLVNRSWNVTDLLYESMTSSQSVPLPSLGIDLGLYPVAFGGSGALSNIGLIGGFQTSVGGRTTTPATLNAPGEELTTEHMDYYVGARFRIPSASGSELGISGAYGQESLKLVDDQVFSFLPDANYTYQRFGIDGKLRFSKFGIGLAMGYLAVSEISSDPGQLAHPDWFPNAEADGMQGTFKVSYYLTSSLSASGRVDYRRYGVDFKRTPADQDGVRPLQSSAINPNTGAPFGPQPLPVAGGATDEYLGLWLGISYEIPAG